MASIRDSSTATDELKISADEIEVTTIPEIDHAAECRILRKTDMILVPMLCLLLIVAYLDRTNIGNARILGMEQDLNMHGTDYNIALFMFFIPYLLLDVPCNILMDKVRPSRYLSALMFSWGIVTIGEGVTKSYAGLVVCRVLLGFLEAGFFPGAIYLLAMYYTRYELHTRMNIYYSAGLVSTAFGGLLAYAIGHMDNVGGYSAWRWVFLIEGIFTVVIAVFTYFALPDWPAQAKHLTEDEREVLLRKLARDTREYTENLSTLRVLKDCLKDPKVYLSSFMYFGTAVTSASSAYFLPTILRDLGWTSLKAQYMSIPIWMSAFVTSIVAGFVSDYANHRFAFCIGPLVLSIIGYALLVAQQQISVGIRYMSLYFVICGCFSAITVSLTWMNNNIVGTKRRGISTAILLGFGNCGSIMGSNVYLSKEATTYHSGYSVALAMVIFTQLSATAFFFHVWYENKQKENGNRDHLLNLPQAEQDTLGDKHPSYRYTY